MDDVRMIGDLSRALSQQGLRPFIEAGAALATIADPANDLCDIAGIASELADQLEEVAKDLRRAYDIVGDKYDAIEDAAEHMPPQEAVRVERVAQQNAANIECVARQDAARAAKHVLVGLVALIAELDAAEMPR